MAKRSKADQDEQEEKVIVKPAVDAYTGMLVISLLALVAGGVLLWLDFSRYPSVAPPKQPPKAITAPPADQGEDKQGGDKKGGDKLGGQPKAGQ
jgi:hypothetical protein